MSKFESAARRALATDGPPGPISADARKQFFRDGYLIVRDLAGIGRVRALRAQSEMELDSAKGPVELEADLGYPGAPTSRAASGGQTIRRLLDAWSRAEIYRSWATDPAVTDVLSALMGTNIVMPRAHHNCIMTKQPAHSSETGWHQDIRYWSYERPELISAWLALGSESPENGGLWLVPGSHRIALDSERFDHAQFFRTDLPENSALIGTKIAAQLNPGDVLFFHCLTLHAAGRNQTDETKYSLVFTYRPANNHPRAGTRSSKSPEVALD